VLSDEGATKPRITLRGSALGSYETLTPDNTGRV
jgi:hypothetical protein